MSNTKSNYKGTDELIEEITNFLIEKTKDLDNETFKEVMQEVEMSISDQLTALELDEANEE
ncbi:hypothetical protein SAMN05421786_11517 [Chryseobacterium ureilyticum]|uniref:Uncharacterized protein n=1 Tax=Chryseobacterium ureilyticum TaxID=373668 RepID=A0A1N7QRJ8_9FLAO|nr:hypothetical protein [Chryseobacterium ureilyticum]SIT25503.1 hypothetical protein SAMN05421786_11517 [Chryseobacterium ureilyticum]